MKYFFSRFSGAVGGALFDGFQWFWAGWVGDRRNGGGGRSVRWSVGQSGGGPVLSQSWPSLGPVLAQPLKRKAWSDIASSVWELSLVWRRLNIGFWL